MTSRAKSAVGLASTRRDIEIGSPADLVIFGGRNPIEPPKDVFSAVTVPDSTELTHSVYRGFRVI